MTSIAYRPERPDDASLIDALIHRAFGPGRHAKAADRLREGNRLIPKLSFTAWEGERLVGSVRMWPVLIGDAPVVFLGPIAVEAEMRKHRIGQTLVEMACEASAEAGWRAVLLVGDAPYFGRVGFEAEPAACRHAGAGRPAARAAEGVARRWGRGDGRIGDVLASLPIKGRETGSLGLPSPPGSALESAHDQSQTRPRRRDRGGQAGARARVAAGASVASGALRRDRHPHPQGRGLVPRRHAHRARGAGAAVLDGAAA